MVAHGKPSALAEDTPQLCKEPHSKVHPAPFSFYECTYFQWIPNSCWSSLKEGEHQSLKYPLHFLQMPSPPFLLCCSARSASPKWKGKQQLQGIYYSWHKKMYRKKNENLLGIFQRLKMSLINHQNHHFMNYWKVLRHCCDGRDESTQTEGKETWFSVQKCLFWGREARNCGSIICRSMKFTWGQSSAYIFDRNGAWWYGSRRLFSIAGHLSSVLYL